MKSRPVRYLVVVGLFCVGILVVLLCGLFSRDDRADTPPEDPKVEEILGTRRTGQEYPALEITYPLDNALFPPEIVAPTFRWKDEHADADTWLVTIEFPDGNRRMKSLSRIKEWTPSPQQWEAIKRRSLETEAKVTVVGVNRAAPEKILSAVSITISTSKDEVGAPLFYREVNLPFIDAVKDPSRIRWRFGDISSKKQPPIVLEGLPVCGNCHSFSADGKVLGMDVDYANDKGSYAIGPVAGEMILSKDNIITWSDYKREDGKPTFGLLSQVSPDGKYVVSTVKDRSVFVATPGVEFSQLFFPIRGILAVYCRETGEFHSLPGADDPRFVQSNATWSPDGKTVVFARSKAHPLKTIGNNVLLAKEECREFLHEGKTFLFDLFRIPFNDGKGGQAEPIEGASNNGMSNYFPKCSPDGKWIVFCKAKSFMLLQRDSQLYIMPADGGEARRMRCNTSRMNSWHSWSPNAKWMVFSSKANGPYTQLWLTHIDREGRSSPPVLLAHFTAPDRAANIPEFVNLKSGAIKRISQQFVDDYSFLRAGNEFLKAKDLDGAVRSFHKALEINPNNAEAHYELGTVLSRRGEFEEAIEHYKKALEIHPKNAVAHNKWGNALADLGRLDQAIEHYKKALEIHPKHPDAHNDWGNALLYLRRFEEAARHYQKALEINPRSAAAHSNWGTALMNLGKVDQAIEHYRKAIEIDPTLAGARVNLDRALRKQGKSDEAIAHWQQAAASNPANVQFRLGLGNALAGQGNFQQAVTQFQKAVEIDSNNVAAINDLAWLLATCPKDGIRDGARAVELAERVCEATGHRIPAVMDTLAAAYAEAGKFPEAIATATKALGLAEPKQKSLAERIRRRLEQYKGGKPYRDLP